MKRELSVTDAPHTEQYSLLKQLMTTLQYLPTAAVLVDSQGTIVQANHAAEQLFAYPSDSLHNQPLELLIPQDRREIHNKLLSEYAATPTNCPKGTGLPRHGLRQDGSMFEADIAFAPIKDTDSIAFLATIHDISAVRQTEVELRQVNRSLRLLSSVNQLIAQVGEVPNLLQEVCRAAVEVSSYRMAWIGIAEQFDEKKVRPVAFHGFNNGFIENLNISWGTTGNHQNPVGEAIRTGIPVIHNNILTTSLDLPCRADAKQRGYHSVAVLPLEVNGAVWGALVLFAPESSAFCQKECKVLTELAQDLSVSLQTMTSQLTYTEQSLS